MLIKSFVIYCLFACALAWLAPERCAQSKKSRRSLSATKDVEITPSIEEIAAKQHELLNTRYSNHQFLGVPIRADCSHGYSYPIIYAPYNCTFHTYKPRLLSSVACSSDVACKLTHTVSTVDTYTSSEGYNWGVKISAKAKFLDIFEVGGEVSAGGTYSCTYTKGRTTTDAVECSTSSGKSGHLQLYNVKSDMVCDFGVITMQSDDRNGIWENNFESSGNFTESEMKEITDSAAIHCSYSGSEITLARIDLTKISSRVLQKVLNIFPKFNPYTDMVSRSVDNTSIIVFYYKIINSLTVNEFRKIIPFTNEGGDSEFKYACVLTQM